MKKYIALITISISLSLHTCIVMGAAEPEYAHTAESCVLAPIQSNNALMRETPLTKELTTILTDFCPGIIHLIGNYLENRWREQTIKTGKSVSSLAISPDGNTITAGTNDGFLKLFNPKTGKLILSWHGHKKSIRSLDFSPNSTLIARQ